ncbi:MAG TPA: cell wall hydrolase [Allosphingosinicella sp.]
MIRAAGIAAASLLAVFGTLTPSLAWEVDAAPAATAFTTHAAASIDGSDAFLNGLESEATPAITGAPLPIAEHAMASLPAEAPEESEAEAPKGRSLAELVDAYASTDIADSEHECLAGAVYFESKGEPLAGQLTVAEVVLNRSTSGRFPASVCGVVKQRGQFSFIRAGRFPPIARTSAAWRKAVAIAHIAKADLADGAAPKALFFHARHVKPSWTRLTRVASVGNHIFYR